MNSDELFPAQPEETLGIQEASRQTLVEEERIPAAVSETASMQTILAQEAVAESPETSQSNAASTGVAAEVPDPWGEPAPRVPLRLDRSAVATPSAPASSMPDANPTATELQAQAQALKQEIGNLQHVQAQLQSQIAEAQSSLGRLIQEGLSELEQRKQALQISVEQLERRQERIRKEMRSTFAGSSQEVAIRIQSFKEYLVGSLQDLALAAEQLNLPTPAPNRAPERPSPADAPANRAEASSRGEAESRRSPAPRFAEQSFQEQTKRIRSLLDQYRNRPDYYGAPWQLRRTFEPIHAERVSNWFFTQGGRGAIRTMGSRLQNILIASATISALYSLYGDRLRVLALAQSPERLGEWRRGLQDCLGITRSEFGTDRGVALFEDPYVLAQKADRFVKDGLMPLIIIDDTEEQVSLAMLQFPLWLAFAPNPQVQPPASYSSY